MTDTGPTPNPIDVHVGQQLKQRRNAQNMSQTALAEAIGVSFQQIQKYERGANRVSASMLWAIAGELDVEPGYFFEGLRRGR